MHIKGNRTPSKYIGYGLYLYFLGLSYRNTSKALARFVKRSHVSIWNWIQKYHPKKYHQREKGSQNTLYMNTDQGWFSIYPALGR